MKLDNIEINWLGHAGFKIKNSKIIYIDPYMVKEQTEKADILLITHGHYDHCSLEDMKKVVKAGTKVFITADAQSKLARFDIPLDVTIVEPDQDYEIGGIKISTFRSYNLDKHFHPKEESWVGYLIKVNRIIVYHSGDSDVIPEMQKLTGYHQPEKKFVALLPVGGRYTMTAEEAVEAAKIIKPTLAIPMHWGSIVGTEDDAKEFVDLCKDEGINAEILEKE